MTDPRQSPFFAAFVSLVLSTPWVPAQAAGEAPAPLPAVAGAPAAVPYSVLAAVLDPEVADAPRQQALVALRAAAEAGNSSAQLVLGSLYRLGPQHPAKLLPRDDAAAEAYLSNAAVNGEIQAMAAMAELELRRDQPRAAMVWTQLFIHFQVQESLWFKAPQSGDAKAYATYLIARNFNALGDGADMEAVQRDVNDFAARHGESFRAGSLRRARARRAPALHLIKEQRENLPPVKFSRSSAPPEEAAQLLYLIDVAPNGRIRKQLLVDGVPDERMGRRLAASFTQSAQFNTVGPGHGPRTALVPLFFNSRATRLMDLLR